MKRIPPLAASAILIAAIVVALIAAGCTALPPLQGATLPPTVSVFAPQVGAGSGAAASPLEPTATAVAAPPMDTVVPPTATPPPTETPHPTATPAPTLVGTIWEWVSSAFRDGVVLAAGDPTRYTLQLLGDGNAMVQADCNFGAGTWQEAGAGLTFGSIGATKMACPPDSLDSAFLAQLHNVASYTFADGELILTLKDGAGTMRLRAAQDAAVTFTGIAESIPVSARQ